MLSSFCFLQCLYVSLPALLECNPFQNESREGWRAAPPLPEELRRVVLIYQAALDLLRQYEVHPEITSQMFAYLFFFSNTLLFNQLLDKGQSLSSSWFSLFGLMQGTDLLRPPSPSQCPLGRGGFEQLEVGRSHPGMGRPSTNPAAEPMSLLSQVLHSQHPAWVTFHGFGFCCAYLLPGSY